MEKHRSKIEQLEQLQRNFMRTHCEQPCHWCSTGEPIPEDGRAYRSTPGVTLRKRLPCRHYDPKKGCTNIKHPKYGALWKE